ncbi:hypothetical protein O181_127509 [Austropuccinia psidii MF-1]|uniref:Uncharacterized protein n=1 Tax=Austropuccinia psidii MF-1 TaxID=1389203 RepID=A0A9Q3Q792_9BASI|nr:hypothetical protein [Austropuccinia psidii MF-1]
MFASIPTTLPPPSPTTSHTTRPALNPAVRPTPVQQPRKSPITTCRQLQPVVSSSRRRARTLEDMKYCKEEWSVKT